MSLRIVGLSLIVCLLLSGCTGLASNSVNTDINQQHINKYSAAQARLGLGMAYLQQRDFEQAYFNLHKAIQYAPDDYRMHLGMALYEQQIGEYDAVEKRYQKALQLAPGNGDILNNYGAFLCYLGQYNKAQQQFSFAALIEDYRINLDSLENSGYCFLKQGQKGKGNRRLTQVIRRSPDRGKYLLLTIEYALQQQNYSSVKELFDVYQQNMPNTAQSLWLKLRFAKQEKRDIDVKRYSQLLAKNFSQSQQYQQFLANEY